MRAYLFFFFEQKTAYEMRISDWSSDVCSSDRAPAPREDKGQLLILQGPVLVGEADTAEKLCVSLHALFDARHPDQDKADALPVEQVTQIFQPRVGQAVGFIDDQQFDEMLPGRNDDLNLGTIGSASGRERGGKTV